METTARVKQASGLKHYILFCRDFIPAGKALCQWLSGNIAHNLY
jgi:hypothetical protein